MIRNAILRNPRALIVTLGMLLSCRASAQHFVGIQAGGGTGWVRSDIFENHGGPRLLPGLGLTYAHRFGEHLTLGANLLYQRRGFNDNLLLTDPSGLPMGMANLQFSYNYAALPVKVGYRFGSKISGFGNAGLVPAMLLNAYYRRLETNSDQTYRVDLTDENRRFDLSGIVEAGGGFGIGETLGLQAALTFQHGITSFTDPWFRSRHLNLYFNVELRYELGMKRALRDDTE